MHESCGDTVISVWAVRSSGFDSSEANDSPDAEADTTLACPHMLNGTSGSGSVAVPGCPKHEGELSNVARQLCAEGNPCWLAATDRVVGKRLLLV